MDVYQAIRIRALKSVLDPDSAYAIRRILRWYSKTFHTPLAVVEEMPVEDVFQAYYEEKYAEMPEDALEKEREELLTSSEERYKRIVAEEAEEADLYEMSKIVAAEEAAKKRAGDQTKKVAEIKHQAPGPIMPMEAPESDLPKLVKTVPPDITMTFVDDATFEAELEGFGSMGQPKKP